jgi:hypothetical protein
MRGTTGYAVIATRHKDKYSIVGIRVQDTIAYYVISACSPEIDSMYV